MSFKLLYTPKVEIQVKELKENKSLSKRFRAVKKAFKNLSNDPFYPGLRSKPYTSLIGPNRAKVYESYAENKTPRAYRIFWYYGPSKGQITIISVVPHPD